MGLYRGNGKGMETTGIIGAIWELKGMYWEKIWASGFRV